VSRDVRVTLGPPAPALVGGALLSLTGAVAVLVFGVIATSGVYGSRLAWLLGVVLPLLATSMLLSLLARRASAPTRARPIVDPVPRARARRASHVVFMSAAVLFGLPLALAALLLGVEGLFFAVHGITLLF
jgi:hypothetical protein